MQIRRKMHTMHRGICTLCIAIFKMEIVSRASSGRLSEILGEVTFSYDKMMLRRGMGFAAENALNGWKKKKGAVDLLESYSNGVNAYINELLNSGNLPVEYKILDFKPSQWSPLKVANVYKSMAYDLSFRNEDLEAYQSKRFFW